MGDRTIYVGNVAAELNELTLHALFAHCGTVTQVRLAGDPSFNARFAFVEFAEASMAHTACLLSGLTIADRPLKISMSKGSSASTPASPNVQLPSRGANYGTGFGSGGGATKRQDPDRIAKTIHIGGVDSQVSEVHLVQYFSVCGPVVGVRISGESSPRFAWVEFSSREAALAALSLDGQELGSQTLRISPSKSAIQTNALVTLLPRTKQQEIASTVHVGGVPPTTSEEDLHRFFSSNCGKIRRLAISGDNSQVTRAAFVEFELPLGAAMALNLAGTPFNGSTLRVTRAKTPMQSPSPSSPPSLSDAHTPATSANAVPLPSPPSPTPPTHSSNGATTIIEIGSTFEPPPSIDNPAPTSVPINSNSSPISLAGPSPSPSSYHSEPRKVNSEFWGDVNTSVEYPPASSPRSHDANTAPNCPAPSITPVAEGEETEGEGQPAGWGEFSKESSYYVTDVQGNKRTSEDYPQSDKRQRWA